MTWFLLWLVLVLGALAVLGLLGWRIFRKGLAVAREIGAAGEKAGETGATHETAFDAWLARRADEDLAAAEERDRQGDHVATRWTRRQPVRTETATARRTMSRTDPERS